MLSTIDKKHRCGVHGDQVEVKVNCYRYSDSFRWICKEPAFSSDRKEDLTYSTLSVRSNPLPLRDLLCGGKQSALTSRQRKGYLGSYKNCAVLAGVGAPSAWMLLLELLFVFFKSNWCQVQARSSMAAIVPYIPKNHTCINLTSVKWLLTGPIEGLNHPSGSSVT